MSIILKLKSIKSITNFKRYFSVYPILRLPVTSRCNNCMVQIMYTPSMNETPSRNMVIPDGFRLIYHFKYNDFVWINSIIMNCLTAVTVYLFYKQLRKVKYGILEDEETPVDIKTNESPSEGFFQTQITNFKHMRKNFLSTPVKLKFLFLIMVILLFWRLRTNIVLYSYRNGSDYLTEITGLCGYGTKVVKHKAQDLTYFPKRRLYKNKLVGKSVLLIDDCFVDEDEKILFCNANYGRNGE